MSYLEEFHRQYETSKVPVSVNGKSFHFFLPENLDRFIEGGIAVEAFPLWAKIWQASLVLADLLARQAPKRGRSLLEIGCGIGVVGIVAAAFGHEITLTEHDGNALAFARANAEANGLASLTPRPLDWNAPDTGKRFDLLVGSEVVYRDRDFDPLLGLFAALLKPDGEVLLAAEMRSSFIAFLDRAHEDFGIQVQKKTLRSGEETVPVIVARLRRR